MKENYGDGRSDSIGVCQPQELIQKSEGQFNFMRLPVLPGRQTLLSQKACWEVAYLMCLVMYRKAEFLAFDSLAFVKVDPKNNKLLSAYCSLYMIMRPEDV